jgi:hypothetical protein
MGTGRFGGSITVDCAFHPSWVFSSWHGDGMILEKIRMELKE